MKNELNQDNLFPEPFPENLVTEVDDEQLAKRAANRVPSRDAVKKKLPVETSSIAWVDPAAVSISPVAVRRPKDMSTEDKENGTDILESSGQLVRAIGRIDAGGGIEIVGNAYVVGWALAHNVRHPDQPVELAVDLQPIDEDQVYVIVARELGGEPKVVDYERGKFCRQALAHFGSEAAVARAVGKNKGTVNKWHDVARATALLANKIVLKRDVAQRDATWLMQVLGRKPDLSEAPDPELAKEILAKIAEVEPMSAKELFAILRVIAKVEAPKTEPISLIHEGERIGAIIRYKGGPIRIDLTDVCDVELDALVEILRVALEQARRQATL